MSTQSYTPNQQAPYQQPPGQQGGGQQGGGQQGGGPSWFRIWSVVIGTALAVAVVALAVALSHSHSSQAPGRSGQLPGPRQQPDGWLIRHAYARPNDRKAGTVFPAFGRFHTGKQNQCDYDVRQPPGGMAPSQRGPHA